MIIKNSWGKRLAVKKGSWVPVNIPIDYKLIDFQRFEVYENMTTGVLYSGKYVELGREL